MEKFFPDEVPALMIRLLNKSNEEIQNRLKTLSDDEIKLLFAGEANKLKEILDDEARLRILLSEMSS